MSLGIHYWNGTRDANNTLLSNNSTNTIFDEYISIQRNYLYPDLMNTTLASTGQTVLYEVNTHAFSFYYKVNARSVKILF